MTVPWLAQAVELRDGVMEDVIDGHVAPSWRDLAAAWVFLAVVGAGAWIATLRRAGGMGAGPGTMGMTLPVFAGTWVLMMAAMMLPALGPLAAREARHAAADQMPARVLNAAAFGAGFLLPWAAYGAVAFVALAGIEKVVTASEGGARSLGVGIFAIAGLYQLSPWKLRALDRCRAMSGSGGSGAARSLVVGAREGWTCVGCCWALMATLFAAGVMDVPAMASLAGVIFLEKILPRPSLTARLVGAALLGLAVLFAFQSSLLPGLHQSGMGM